MELSFNHRNPVKEGRHDLNVGIYYDPDPLNKGSSLFLNDGIPHHARVLASRISNTTQRLKPSLHSRPI